MIPALNGQVGASVTLFSYVVHAVLVEVCNRVADPRFVHAAMKLVTIKDTSGIGYDEALSRFEEATSKLLHVEKQLVEKKAQLSHAEGDLAQRKQELAGIEKAMAEARRKAKSEEAKLKQGLMARMEQADVKAHEIEDVARLKAEVGKQGLDIATLLKLAKEFDSG